MDEPPWGQLTHWSPLKRLSCQGSRRSWIYGQIDTCGDRDDWSARKKLSYQGSKHKSCFKHLIDVLDWALNHFVDATTFPRAFPLWVSQWQKKGWVFSHISTQYNVQGKNATAITSPSLWDTNFRRSYLDHPNPDIIPEWYIFFCDCFNSTLKSFSCCLFSLVCVTWKPGYMNILERDINIWI